MSDIPNFVVPVPLRCYEPVGGSPQNFCGALATWKRPRRDWAQNGFYCEAHKRAGDGPIELEWMFRRVQLFAEILLAGASLLPAEAEHDALARMARAVESHGGILHVQSVKSQIGRYAVPRPPARTRGGRGRAL